MNGINFNFNDPLLGQRNYEVQFQELERMEEALNQKKNALMQMKEQMTNVQNENKNNQTPTWDEIDNITQTMSDKEFDIVSNNEEFIESQNRIMNILQAKYMQMMRPIVEGSKEGKDALDNHLTLIKRLKKSASKEVDQEINEFKEYKEKYSNMTYQEYINMKRKPQ